MVRTVILVEAFTQMGTKWFHQYINASCLCRDMVYRFVTKVPGSIFSTFTIQHMPSSILLNEVAYKFDDTTQRLCEKRRAWGDPYIPSTRRGERTFSIMGFVSDIMATYVWRDLSYEVSRSSTYQRSMSPKMKKTPLRVVAQTSHGSWCMLRTLEECM